MKVTGERFVPGKMFKHSEIEHMHRYSAVQEILKDKIVLDAACGTGYGSNMIAEVACQVYGVDISQEAIEYASHAFAERKNVRYIQANIMQLPFEDDKFDAVVSFETIEHVDGDTQNAFLKEIRRVLKPSGMLIMSTPNKEIYTVQAGNAPTEWHVKEFFEDEFDAFLRREFQHVQYFQQYISKASYLLENDNSGIVNLKNADSDKKGKFIVAIASDYSSMMSEIGEMNSLYYYPDAYAELDEVCQVFYCFSLEESFTEANSEIVEVSSKQKEIKIEVEFEEDEKIQKVRIDPLNNSSAIKCFSIEILTSDNEKIVPEVIINNSDVIAHSINYFYHNDPQYVVELKSAVYIKKIFISYVIEQYKLDAYSFLTQKMNSLEDTLNKERKEFEIRCSLFDQRNEYVTSELLWINKEREAIEQERKSIMEERISINAERDYIVKEHAAINAERDYIAKEHAAIDTERDHIAREYTAIKEERETIKWVEMIIEKKQEELKAEHEAFSQKVKRFYDQPLRKRIMQVFAKHN